MNTRTRVNPIIIERNNDPDTVQESSNKIK